MPVSVKPCTCGTIPEVSLVRDPLMTRGLCYDGEVTCPNCGESAKYSFTEPVRDELISLWNERV